MSRLADFDYGLPRDRIAQDPPRRRGDARLMVVPRGGGAVVHARFRDLAQFLRRDDLLVLNDTRVIPARLVGRRPTGGRIAVLLLRPSAGGRRGWEVLARGGRRLVGETLTFGRLRGRMTAWRDGRGRMEFEDDPLGARAGAARRAPLPPYIRRPKGPDARRRRDLRRYQTVYARAPARRSWSGGGGGSEGGPGAIAAPTAGLHLTRAHLARLARTVEVTSVTLHVGPGTFLPVTEEDTERHRMESEWYGVGAPAAAALRAAKAAGRRVIAVGTTTCRALETAARGPGFRAHTGRTDLFIRPPFAFRAVDGLITNFHLPRSTLLMLVCAFAGRERVLGAYAEAVRAGYGFYSYGDAMLLL